MKLIGETRRYRRQRGKKWRELAHFSLARVLIHLLIVTTTSLIKE